MSLRLARRTRLKPASAGINDAFTAADGTWNGIATDGVAWNLDGNTFNIASNRVLLTTRAVSKGGGATFYRDLAKTDFDATIVALFPATGGGAVKVWGAFDPAGGTGYEFHTDGSGAWTVYSWGGSATLPGTALDGTFASGPFMTDVRGGAAVTYRFRKVGQVLTVYENGVQTYQFTDTNAALTGTKVGVGLVNANKIAIDNYAAV